MWRQPPRLPEPSAALAARGRPGAFAWTGVAESGNAAEVNKSKKAEKIGKSTGDAIELLAQLPLALVPTGASCFWPVTECGHRGGTLPMTTLIAEGGTRTEWQRRHAGAGAALDREPRDDVWFANLYSQTFDTVYHFARTLVRDHDTAEDIVADTYLRAWRARLNFTGQGSPLSWVMAITHNCAMDHLRARKPNVSLDLFDAIGDPEGPGSGDPPLCEGDAEAIRRAIARLTPEQQQVIFLRFYQELPHEAVATKLCKSPTAIRQIQFRALVRLRKFLQEEMQTR